MATTLQPLADFPAATRRRVRLVLTDIDDTLTTRGMLPAAALDAMERLAAAGIQIVAVTGRPAGWCDHIARMWPVSAVIGENGAFWFSYDRVARRMLQGYAKSEQERAQDRARLDWLRDRILAEIPGAGIASDQPFRIADLAVDFCEDVERLPPEDIQRIVALFEAEGATAKISSIHVNGWFGVYDKLSMTRYYFTEALDLDFDALNRAGELVYVGDSPNDQPMFRTVRHSVGVANVREFDLEHPPAWVTVARSADGFVELADALLEARG